MLSILILLFFFNISILSTWKDNTAGCTKSTHLKFPLLLLFLKEQSTSNGRRQWQPTPVLLPGEFHGGRSLVGYGHVVTNSRTRLSDFTFTSHFHALEKEMATHSSVLAWRIPGMGRLVGGRLWGHTESDTTKAN